MKYKHFFLALIIILVPFAFIGAAQNNTLAKKLSGRILLQVEENGEAWYVFPGDQKRYYMGRPRDAFILMQQLSSGMTNADLKKIPIGVLTDSTKDDIDGDGLYDTLEEALGTDPEKKDSDQDGYSDLEEVLEGYDPLSIKKQELDEDLVNKYKGRILLQIEAKGQAWYLNPTDEKRYFLGNPYDAFMLMRKLALGITNKNLEKITQWKRTSWTHIEEEKDFSSNKKNGIGTGRYRFSINEDNQSFVIEFSCEDEFSDMTLITPDGQRIDKAKADSDENYRYYTVPEHKKAYFGIIGAQKGFWSIEKNNAQATSCTVDTYLYIDMKTWTGQ